MFNKRIILIAVISVVIIAAVFIAIKQDSGIFAPPAPAGPQPTPIPPLVAPVPPEAEVLDPGEKSTNRDIGTPVSVTPSTTTEGEVTRTFAITASNNVYEPNTIVANVGDTVRIRFKAVDKAYDLTSPTLGLAISAKKGETKTGEFTATTAGKYLFYCDLCGGQNSSTNGYVIVIAPSS